MHFSSLGGNANTTLLNGIYLFLSGLQLGYTVVFGSYVSFLLIRTGCSHLFDNIFTEVPFGPASRLPRDILFHFNAHSAFVR